MSNVSRRDLILNASAASAVFGLSGPLTLIGAAEAKLPEPNKGVFTAKIGNAQLTMLFDGNFSRVNDGSFVKNASKNDVGKALTEAGLPSDNVIIPFTVPVVSMGGKTIMFDAGTGGQMAPTAGQLAGNMKAAGIDPSKIDTIIVTHFHPDHIFGLMAKDTNAPIYPNAEIVVPDAELDYWGDPTILEKLPEARRGLAKRVQDTLAKWKNVRRVSDGKEAVPNITAISAFGHTPGHTVYRIETGDAPLMIMGDTANVPFLFARHPGWHVVFDQNPVLAEVSRKAAFGQVVDDGAIMTGYHFGFPGAGTLKRESSGFTFTPLS